MIRQAISCDMCGAEMQHANHWFVAIEQGGELRVAGWNPRGRLRAGAKHLCGQTCLHKLVDDFVAHTAPARNPAHEPAGAADVYRAAPRKAASRPAVRTAQRAAESAPELQPTYIDEFESSARLIPTPQVAEAPVAATTSPAGATRMWRTEAWKREREREQNQSDHRTKPFSRRRSIA